jgi:DNA-binding NtrC family response regulator
MINEEIIKSTESLPILRMEDAKSRSDVVFKSRLKALRIIALALIDKIDILERSTDENQLNITEEVRRFEAALIIGALEQTRGSQRQAARLLGIKVTTLHEKIKRYKINPTFPPEKNRALM